MEWGQWRGGRRRVMKEGCGRGGRKEREGLGISPAALTSSPSQDKRGRCCK